jgi:hypothetical protein
MNKYVEIIQDGLPYLHYCHTEETMIGIVATIEVAMEFINNNWVEQCIYEEFLHKIKNDKENNPSIIKMIKALKAYHKELLEECEKDPAWKKFDNGERKGIKPGIYDGF